MSRLYPALLEAAAASLFLIPCLLHLGKHKENKTVAALQILFAVYLATVYAIAGLPSVLYVRFSPNFNATPFLYMFSDHTTSLLNVLLFLPLGIFLPVLWTRFRNIFRTVFCGLCISASIEFLQLFTYRATDVNDLITNSLGTFLGFCIGMLVIKLKPKLSHINSENAFLTILSAVFCIMFFLQPFLVRAFLYFN